MPLTDTTIRRTKCLATPQKLRDGNGLYLLLRPDGARWWRYDYRRPVTGKRNTLSFGTYPEVSLADAREKLAEARRLLAAKVDPGEQRKAVKAAGEAADLAQHDQLEASHRPLLRMASLHDFDIASLSHALLGMLHRSCRHIGCQQALAA